MADQEDAPGTEDQVARTGPVLLGDGQRRPGERLLIGNGEGYDQLAGLLSRTKDERRYPSFCLIRPSSFVCGSNGHHRQRSALRPPGRFFRRWRRDVELVEDGEHVVAFLDAAVEHE